LLDKHDCKGGIIDPVKVTKTALQNASSCAGTLITTNYGIIQTEDRMMNQGDLVHIPQGVELWCETDKGNEITDD
jgi:hypothetical protein